VKRYVLSKSAKADLDDIWFFLARKSASVTPAERILQRLQDAIILLAAQPGIGRRCEDIDENGRCLPIGDYIIYYRADTRRRILITHIFHGKRDQRRAWRQSPKR
jgi:toxin ParE1/3/4